MASAGPSRTGWTIREYRDSDFAAIRSCVAELQELERRLDARLRPGEAMAEVYLVRLLEQCRACEGRIFLADDPSGAVAGFVAVLARVPFTELDDPPGAFALLSDLFVAESCRGQGLGRALIDHAERFARAAGASEIRVHLLAANERARALYERGGFDPYLETRRKLLGS